MRVQCSYQNSFLGKVKKARKNIPPLVDDVTTFSESATSTRRYKTCGSSTLAGVYRDGSIRRENIFYRRVNRRDPVNSDKDPRPHTCIELGLTSCMKETIVESMTHIFPVNRVEVPL